MKEDKVLIATCGGIIGSKWKIIKTSYREGFICDELTSLVIELSPMTSRKNKSDRKRNRKQRWC